LRVGGGQFRAHAVQLPAHLLENRIVPPGGVPHLEFVAKFFQRSAIAFVECVLRFAQLGDDAIGGFFDPLFVVRRQFQQSAYIGRAPLQTGRRTFGCVVCLFVPVERGLRIAALFSHSMPGST